MLPLLAAEFRWARGRAVALFLAVLVAACGFTVLTATAQTSRLQVQGTVAANARSAYDVLVRPAGSRSQAERARGLVRADFLSGIFGGITEEQWRQVVALPDVDVAAPVAMVGYVLPRVVVPVDVTTLLSRSPQGAARVGVTWTAGNGTSTVPAPAQYVYVTPNRLAMPESLTNETYALTETGAGMRAVKVCPLRTGRPGPYSRDERMDCWSRRASGLSGREDPEPEVPAGRLAALIEWPMPFLLAAVDPAQEARLAGLDRAVTSGRYLHASDTAEIGGVPVLVSQQPEVDLQAHVDIRRLGRDAVEQIARGATAEQLDRAIIAGRLRAEAADTLTITVAQVYRRVLATLRSPTGRPLNVDSYWTASPVDYEPSTDPRTPLRPKVVRNPDATWASSYYGTEFALVPPTTADTQVRRMQAHPGDFSRGDPLQLRGVGTFDPGRLPGYSDLSRVPLGTYHAAQVHPADQVAYTALHGQPLLPDGNLAGYLQPSPLLLTSLDGAAGLFGAKYADGAGAAPISSIRVRVAGVIGVDPVSRERVRVVAERITAATGLDVDITVGSSPAAQAVELPAGRYGRPALTVRDDWVKKGVAVAVLQAVDRKSLLLFGLILAVCALVVANTAVASVQSRRAQLGMLACVGWSPRQLFTLVGGELLGIATLAGLAAAGASLPVAAAVGVRVSLARACLAVPAAALLCGAAGLVPAALAARADPMDAARTPVRAPGRAGRISGVAALAVANIRRTPGRGLLAGGGLAVSIAAFTFLVGITLAFRGGVVGSLLGDAVAVQVRGVDYAAAAATLALAGFGLGNLLLIGLNERATEFATLRALGWTEQELRRLLLIEGLTLGAVAAVGGAGLGLLGVIALATLTPAVFAAAGVALAVGLAITTLATAAALTAIRRLPTVELLSLAE